VARLGCLSLSVCSDYVGVVVRKSHMNVPQNDEVMGEGAFLDVVLADQMRVEVGY
jgi:hypothetical protein